MKKIHYFFLLVTLAVIGGRIHGLLMAANELGQDAEINYSAWFNSLAIRLTVISIWWVIVVGIVWIYKKVKGLLYTLPKYSKFQSKTMQYDKNNKIQDQDSHVITESNALHDAKYDFEVELEGLDLCTSNVKNPSRDNYQNKPGIVNNQTALNDTIEIKCQKPALTKSDVFMIVCFLLMLLAFIIPATIMHANSVDEQNSSDSYGYRRHEFWAKVEQEVKENQKETIKKAEQGDAKSQYDLGCLYDTGFGIRKDCKDYKKAIKWYTKAAEQGYAEAQLSLGGKYFGGRGVEQNYQEALFWYTKAANQGVLFAQVMLGGVYMNGLTGVPKDDKEAFKWLSMAANQGNSLAQFNLGMMYCMGEGVPINYIMAYKWLNIVAAQGNSSAANSRDILRNYMSASQIAEAQKLSREFKPKK